METEIEWKLTNSVKSDLILYLDTHPEKFDDVINLAIVDKQPYSWRAAWLIWSCMEENDQRITAYIKRIIDVLPLMKDNQQRELLIILNKMEISEELEGTLYNHCITIWEKIGKMPSLRYNAFKVIVRIVKKYPELKKEIVLLTQNQYMDSLSSTARKSIFEMINI